MSTKLEVVFLCFSRNSVSISDCQHWFFFFTGTVINSNTIRDKMNEYGHFVQSFVSI